MNAPERPQDRAGGTEACCTSPGIPWENTACLCSCHWRAGMMCTPPEELAEGRRLRRKRR